jgi:hypothetical protein
MRAKGALLLVVLWTMISKPGSPHRDWVAMIAYLVTKLEVSRRAVTAQDLRQLKRWAHNHDAVLRRAAPVGASTPTVGTDLCQDCGASKRWLLLSEGFRLAAFLCGRVRGHAFLIRMGLRIGGFRFCGPP